MKYNAMQLLEKMSRDKTS